MVKEIEYGGKSYRTDRGYRDQNGRVWTFTGRRQQMNTENGSAADESPLPWVADFLGPLQEV